MSAFIVNKHHIDALMTAYNRLTRLNGPKSDRPEELSRLGQVLVDENFKSVNCRYDEKTTPYKYEFSETEDYQAAQIFKAIHCLDYQSCEHKGWEKSKARAFLDELEHFLADALPGYGSAEWEIQPPKEAIMADITIDTTTMDQEQIDFLLHHLNTGFAGENHKGKQDTFEIKAEHNSIGFITVKKEAM